MKTPPIPVEKVDALLSDPETLYEFWLEHKPDLIFGEPLIFLIFKYSFQKVNIELFNTVEYIQSYSLHS